MDEWVIQGIKAENDFVYELYKGMKKSIEEARKSNVKDLYMREITDTFSIIKGMTTLPFPLQYETKTNKLPIYFYMIFLLEIKTITNSMGKINFDILKKYFSKRKKSKLLDGRILRVDFDTISQYLVKDNYIEFRELTTALIFWNVNVFDDDSLLRYRRALLREVENKPV